MSLTKIQPSGLDQTGDYSVDSLSANTILASGTNFASVTSTANASLVLAQGAFDASNTNAGLIVTVQGVNDAQNTTVTAVSNYAVAAYGQANTVTTVADNAYTQAVAGTNSAQAAYNASNTNSTIITGVQAVNVTQNTNITAVNAYATSGYAKANSVDILATAAFGAANSVVGLTSASYEKANSVDILATAAFGAANNKLDLSSGGTISGSSSFTGQVTFQETLDVVSSLSGATGTVTHDVSSGAIFYHTSPAANFTANFTNVPTTNDRTFVVTLIVVQGATPYIPNAVQIDGSAQTIKWANSTAPTGTASKTEIFAFSLVRTGDSWSQVLGQSATYG